MPDSIFSVVFASSEINISQRTTFSWKLKSFNYQYMLALERFSKMFWAYKYLASLMRTFVEHYNFIFICTIVNTLTLIYSLNYDFFLLFFPTLLKYN